MSGRIFAKFDIASKHSFDPNTCSVQYRYMTLQSVYLGFVISLTSGQFRDMPIVSQWGKIMYLKYLGIRALQIAQNDYEYG